MGFSWLDRCRPAIAGLGASSSSLVLSVASGCPPRGHSRRPALMWYLPYATRISEPRSSYDMLDSAYEAER
jgi:hypothetical protein